MKARNVRQLMKIFVSLAWLAGCLAPISGAQQQSAIVPTLVNFSSVLTDLDGKPLTNITGVTFLLYQEENGGTPLWMETQNVQPDSTGRYSVTLGSTTSTGMPADLFVAGEARWLGVQPQGQPGQPRIMLLSVPYALKAGDAETLGGRPASAYALAGTAAVLAPNSSALAGAGIAAQSSVSAAQPLTTCDVTSDGTAAVNALAKFTTACNVEASAISDTSGNIGIGGTNSSAKLYDTTSLTNFGTRWLQHGVLITSATSNGTNLSLGFDVDSTNMSISSGVTDSGYRLGIRSSAYANTTSFAGTLAEQFGVFGTAGISQAKSGAKVTSAFGGEFVVLNNAPGTTITNAYGVYIANSGTAGTITNRYDLFASSPNAKNYFAGKVGVGTTTPAASLDVHGTGNFTGLVTFASGQTFSGAAELTAANIFTQGASFGGPVSAGSSTSGGAAVTGNGTGGAYGVGGNSATGFGVYADAMNPADGTAGVFGFTLGAYSNSYLSEAGIAAAGVWGDTSGNNNGVAVAVFGTADNNYAAAFINNSGSFPGLFVDNNSGTGVEVQASSGYGVSASTSAGNGVYGTTSSGGSGVEGLSSNLADQQAGVLGIGNTTSGTYGAYNIYSGVWGDTGTSSTTVAPAWAIGVLGTADDSHAGVFLNNSATWTTMYVSNAGSGGTGSSAPPGLFTTLYASTRTGTCGIGGNGDLTCTGQVKTLATTSGGARTVETYAMQSPENWIEDFGSGVLTHGTAVVNIDAAFAETVSDTADYHVFITPNGDSKGLYVIRKTAASFEVRESGGGMSSLSFDYRIVAKRRGYEVQRLNDVTERFDAEQKAGPPPTVPNNHSTPARTPVQGTGRSQPNTLRPRLIPGRN
jgi:hypothetical protein